jgi:hypothetical protein
MPGQTLEGWQTGGCKRKLLWAAYTVAFLCLLQFDEVLCIQVKDIEFSSSAEIVLHI